MAVSGIQISVLDWDALDQSQAFREWKTLLTSYFVISDVPPEKKWHYVLMSSDSKGHELWNSWSFTEEQAADVIAVFNRFENHLVGTPNKWVIRLELSSMMQKEGEPIDDFICRLRAKAKSCAFRSDAVRDE